MRAGGLSCGCFDGRYPDGDEGAVAIRCAQHLNVPQRVPKATIRTVASVRVASLLPTVAQPSPRTTIGYQRRTRRGTRAGRRRRP